METNIHTDKEDDEITLKELILKIQEFYKEIIINWKLVFLFIIPFIVFMIYRTITTDVTYPATLTFMLDEDDGGGLGALGGLAASFGIGGKRGGEFNLDKMLALSKSRNIIQQVLFEKILINDKIDYFANHIIDEYDLLDEWKEVKLLKDFTRFSNSDLALFTRPENQILKILHSKIIGNESELGILSSKISDDTGIMTMNVASTSETLSINLVNSIFEKLSHFYIDKSIAQQENTYLLTKAKADSLKIALNTTQYQLLKFKDTNRNLSLRQFEAKELQLERNAQILTIAYGEALKNQEFADFTLRSKTPFIQPIDFPIAPLKPSKDLITYIKNIIIGAFLGGFLSLIFIIGRKIFRETMNS